MSTVNYAKWDQVITTQNRKNVIIVNNKLCEHFETIEKVLPGALAKHSNTSRYIKSKFIINKLYRYKFKNY